MSSTLLMGIQLFMTFAFVNDINPPIGCSHFLLCLAQSGMSCRLPYAVRVMMVVMQLVL